MDTGVKHLVAHAQHEATDDVGIDPAGQLDAPAGPLLDALTYRAYEAFAQLVAPDAQLLLDLVELAALHCGLEQRAGVDLGDLLHQRRLAFPSGAKAEKSTSARASSIKRFWSSSLSDFRATFSVAVIVRSATSLRISSSARRVSAWISRRVRSIASWWSFCDFALASASNCSAALRDRTRMSSACSRASFKRWRYSSSSLSASWRVCSAC